MFKSHLDALRRYRRLSAEYKRMDRKRIAAPPFAHPDPASWSADGITLAWLGHATVLMRIFGTWVITDPVLGNRIGMSLGPVQVGVRRLSAPALRVKELPKIDLVILSHAHFDHLDLPTLARIPRSAVVVASKNLRDLLRRFRDVRELEWGETTKVGGIEIESTPAKHWGARMITDRHRGWGGFLLTSHERRILFAGDTALTPDLRPLAKRGPLDLAIMPIGAYDPWITNHCSPEEAWQMAQELGAEHFLPIHHSTFRLSREPWTEPLERLRKAAGSASKHIVVSRIGETWQLDVPKGI